MNWGGQLRTMTTVYYRQTFLLRDQLEPLSVRERFYESDEIQYLRDQDTVFEIELLPIPSFTSQTWQLQCRIPDALFTALQLKYSDSPHRHLEPVRGLEICGQ